MTDKFLGTDKVTLNPRNVKSHKREGRTELGTSPAPLCILSLFEVFQTETKLMLIS